MQNIADIYNNVKPIQEKTYVPATTDAKQFASTGHKNSSMLNEIYADVISKNAQTSQSLIKESSEDKAREKHIHDAIKAVSSSYTPQDDAVSLRLSVDDYIKSKTGTGLSAAEDDMVVNTLKRVLKQEDEINMKKADLDKSGDVSEYEMARAKAAFGEEDEELGYKEVHGRGDDDDAPAVRAEIQEKKSYSAKEAHKGKDIGKPGKQFAKIAKGAAKKYHSKKAGKKVAGAVLAKLRKEKFEFLGGKTNKNLMDATNYKLQAPKGFKAAGSGKNTAVKATHNKPVTKSFLSANEPAKEPAFINNSGPKSAGAKTLQDPIEPGPDQDDNYYEVNKFSQGVKKMTKESINNGMKNDKSIFDRLYEDVMADDDAIALGATDAALESDFGGEEAGADEGGDITLTLPRDVAQHLHALLSDILGSDSDAENYGDEDSAGMEDEDEQALGDNEPMGEEIEAEEIGTPLVNQKKGNDYIGPKGKNNVVDSTVSKLAKHGKVGDSKVTDKVGDDGEEGVPLVSQKKGLDLANPKGKHNVVKSTVSSKTGDTFFQSAS